MTLGENIEKERNLKMNQTIDLGENNLNTEILSNFLWVLFYGLSFAIALLVYNLSFRSTKLHLGYFIVYVVGMGLLIQYNYLFVAFILHALFVHICDGITSTHGKLSNI